MLDLKLVNWMMQSVPNLNYVYRSLDKDLLPEIISYEVREVVENLAEYYSRHKQVPSFDVVRNVMDEKNQDYDILKRISIADTTENEIGFVVDKIKERFNKKIVERFIENYSSEKSVSDVNEDLKKIVVTADRVNRQEVYSEGLIKDSVKERIDEYQYTVENPKRNMGVSFGFKELDNYTWGLKPSEMLVIAGASSSGKSLMMLNMAINAWRGSNSPSDGVVNQKNGKNVVYVSLEMTKPQLEKRVDANMARVDYKNIVRGTMTEEEKSRWMRVLDFQKNYDKHFYILDIPRGSSVAEMEAKFETIAEIYNPDIIYVDYLQLMRPSIGESGVDWKDVGKVSEELHEFCRKKEIPVVTAAQRKAGSSKKGQKNYVDNVDLEDLGRSKMIGDNATVVFLIGKREDELLREDMEIHIVKNRDGAKGTIKLLKVFSQSRIEELPPDWTDLNDELDEV
jgi:replicative DNA helicase